MRKAFFFSLLALSLFGNPSGGEIVFGKGTIEEGASMTITQNSEKMIIDWVDFMIHPDETLTFQQPNQDAAVLNRVISDFPSMLFGKLTANGNVFLINQNGILIGESGQIETGSFLASTLRLGNEEFLHGKDWHFQEGIGSLISEGTITACDDVILISRVIENTGTIDANETYLAAGAEVFLERKEDGMIVRVKEEGHIVQTGLIASCTAELYAAGGNLAELAINHTGVIDAKGALEKEGMVILAAEEGITEVTGKISGDVVHVLGDKVGILDFAEIAGREVLIGGDFQGNNPEIKNAKLTLFGENAKVISPGGKTILWADEHTFFYGTIDARGWGEKDGGFIEISGKEYLDFRGRTDRSSERGKPGTLFLDPNRVEVSTSANQNIIFGAGCGAMTYCPTVGGGIPNIDIGNIATAGTLLFELNVGPVTISNSETIAGDRGDANPGVAILNPIAWSANTLTINATNTTDVFLNAALTLSGTAALSVTSTQDIFVNANISNSAATTVSLSAARSLQVASGVTIENTHSGSGSFTAFSFDANPTSVVGNFSGIDFQGLMGTPIALNSVEGSIELTGIGGTNTTNNGILLTFTDILSSGTGVDASPITLNGTGGAANNQAAGILLTNSTLTTTDGNITLTGGSSGTGVQNYGIHLFETAISASDTATLSMNGTGGAGTDDNYGFYLNSESTLSSVNGNITFLNGSNGVGMRNYGTYLFAESSVTSTGTALIDVTSTSGGGSGAANDGFVMETGALLTSTDGNISFTCSSSATGNSNNGMRISDGSIISSTGAGAGAATITVMATSGAGPTDCMGIAMESISTMTSVDGDIMVTGISNGTGNFNNGIFLSDSSAITASGPLGDLMLTGTGGGGATRTTGTEIDASAGLTALTGNVDIIGGLFIETDN